MKNKGICAALLITCIFAYDVAALPIAEASEGVRTVRTAPVYADNADKDEKINNANNAVRADKAYADKTGKAADSELPDFTRKLSITVGVADDVKGHLDSLKETDASLVADLYKVAGLEKDKNGFTYKIEPQFQYAEETLSSAAASKREQSQSAWNELSQKLAGGILGAEGSYVNKPDKAAYTGIGIGVSQEVEKGLYLLVVRGSGENSTVVRKVTVSGSDIDREDSVTDRLTTYTLLGDHSFTALPMLVCVPGKITPDGSAAYFVNEAGEWVYDLNVTLKMEADPATGSIKINKTLVNYYGDAQNATFVFRVDTYFPDEDTLFGSEVYSAVFDSKGTKSITIDGLPIGALVKVYEVYTGANYTSSIRTGESLNVVVMQDEIKEVDIENTYNGKTHGGGGVINRFEYNITDGGAGWLWSSESDNTTTANGASNRFLALLNSTLQNTVSD